jgi:hypothetical protein
MGETYTGRVALKKRNTTHARDHAVMDRVQMRYMR